VTGQDPPKTYRDGLQAWQQRMLVRGWRQVLDHQAAGPARRGRPASRRGPRQRRSYSMTHWSGSAVIVSAATRNGRDASRLTGGGIYCGTG
jgi:hypothetical protein